MLPLTGIRVVEFSHMVMGPTCGMVLADLGADVIKVEPAPDGDNTRRLPGSGAGFFAAFNRNKRSVALDLKHADGVAFARRLILTADAVTENFRAGALERLGLGAEALRAADPRLVTCALKGFLAGPYAQRTALDEVVQMLGGLAYMTGAPGAPSRAGASVNDIMGGVFAALGVVAALHERTHTGVGRAVTAGLFETNMLFVAQHMAQFAVTGVPAPPMPARLAAWAVYDVFDTADGAQVFVGVVTDGQWRAFCAAFGLADLAADPALRTNVQRVAGRAGFIPTLRAAFAALDQATVLAMCEATGLPFAPINRPEQMFDDPHLNHPGALLPVTLADGRVVRLPALPLALDGARPPLRRDLPGVGEHGREVAAELGYAPAEVDALVAAGVLG